MHQHGRYAAEHLQAYPSGGVVVEALGEAHVLDADRVPDAAPYTLAVGGVGDPAWQLTQINV